MKQFSLQGFLHDLYYFNWDSIGLIDDVEIAWKFLIIFILAKTLWIFATY